MSPSEDIRVAVLVTGFRPFRGANVNASAEAVKRLQHVDLLRRLVVPPDCGVALQLQIIDDVEVEWTCEAELQKPHRPGVGARRIVAAARAMDGGRGADLVVVVGESAALSRTQQHLRIEAFARNRGQCAKDEAGNQPQRDASPLFPGLPEFLEVNIPPSALTRARSCLFEEGLQLATPAVRMQDLDENSALELNPAGAFICNETYYQLLRDAHLGQTGQPPSGRWVLPIHVGAFRTEREFAELARGLSVVIGSLLQSTLVPHGS